MGKLFKPILVRSLAELNNLIVDPGQYIIVKDNRSQYLDTNDGRIQLSSNANIVTAPTKADFPQRGDANSVYISIAENAIYRYDVDSSEYRIVGQDINSVEELNGNAVLITNKHDIAQKLVADNPVLSVAQLCFESDTGRFKIGNGVTPWNNLPYSGEQPWGNF